MTYTVNYPALKDRASGGQATVIFDGQSIARPAVA